MTNQAIYPVGNCIVNIGKISFLSKSDFHPDTKNQEYADTSLHFRNAYKYCKFIQKLQNYLDLSLKFFRLLST